MGNHGLGLDSRLRLGCFVPVKRVGGGVGDIFKGNASLLLGCLVAVGRCTRCCNEGVLCVHVAVALHCYANSELEVYKPSATFQNSGCTERRWCSHEHQYYDWNLDSGVASWCLPVEIRKLSECPRALRVLCFACDEGSTGSDVNLIFALVHHSKGSESSWLAF